MTVRLLIVVAVFSAAVALLSRDQATAAMPAPYIRLSAASGVSVPDVEQLTAKVQNRLGVRAGTRAHVRENGKWVEVKPSPMAERLDGVVLSYNKEEGLAYLHVTYPEYPMPVIQIWRYSGKVWSDSIDPGIFVVR
jgi:hypothetical protein